MLLRLLIVEDNPSLRQALKNGLEATGEIQVVHHCGRGQEACDYCLAAASAEVEQANGDMPDVILMDVQLADAMNGIQAAAAIRREFPRQSFSIRFKMKILITGTSVNLVFSATTPTCANPTTFCRT